MTTPWTDQNKSGGNGPFFFKIDDSFLFLIDNTYQLLLEDGGVTWNDQIEN